MKVLVVHPQEEILKSIRAQMDRWYVETCTTGLDGLIAAKTVTFDLILCAQDLAVITGVEMVRSIRNLSVNRNTPVVFLADGHESDELIHLYQMLSANVMKVEEVSSLTENENDHDHNTK
jgi:DNA-binding response OmpR family regulator